FPLRFVQGYVLRLGFLDGLAGLQVCVLVAYVSWLKQAYLWQMQKGRTTAELGDSEANASTSGLEGTAGQANSSTPREDGQANSGIPREDGHANSCAVPLESPVRNGAIDRVPESTGGAKDTRWRRPSLREIRRRLTPKWLKTDVRRRRRNILIRRLGYQRCFTPPIIIREPSLLVRSCLPFVVADQMLKNPPLTFLQIGAYDGVGLDDLRELVIRYKLRGVMVEPQPEAFARLQQTYRNQPQVTLLQVAIAERDAPRELYCHRTHASMAASFDRQHLRKHGIDDRDIVGKQVACRTVESALRSGGLEHVDLIQIDAEGYDWPIIRSIDFTRLRPRILRFEYRHMGDRNADECLSLLAGHGYRFVMDERDIIAVRIAESSDAVALPRRRSA
ncbi:MAG TPA: FkbM family methyltransferase, partial [Lacipirellulaceae bacterium]|nr:FkbM family methyltransferase [Lacipirellulaceae bacterium]